MDTLLSPNVAATTSSAVDAQTMATLQHLLQTQQSTEQRIVLLHQTIMTVASNQAKTEQLVVVRDIKMTFWSMVIFMVKWAVAAVPALIVLWVIGWIALISFGAFFAALLMRAR